MQSDYLALKFVLIVLAVIALIVFAVIALVKQNKNARANGKPVNNTGFIILILLLVVMAVTNPSTSDYTSWIKEQVTESSDDGFSEAVFSIMADTIVEKSTTRTNLIILSIYTTRIGNESSVTVGAFKNFFEIGEN